MKLHEAIRHILTEHGCKMTTTQIAEEVNRRKLYTKRDGSDVTPFQIHGRTKNYDHMFVRKGPLVGLVASDACLHVPELPHQAEDIAPFVSSELLTQGDVTGTAFLKKMGFKNVGALKRLLLTGMPRLPELTFCGLYAISIPDGYRVSFLSPEAVRRKGNVITPWSIERLKVKWVSESDIIYYGCAGAKAIRSLAARLNDLIKHGLGKTSDNGPHKGGEIMWQLQGYDQFSVWILPTGSPPEPRQKETALLTQFRDITGKLPFANRQL
jgi:hypothetical protein